MQKVENRMEVGREIRPSGYLSRDFVIRSILKIFEEVEAKKDWGSVSVSYKDGVYKTIRQEKTITEEK